MNQYKSGALLTYINMGVTMFGGLWVTPFIINALGKSEYGLYALIGSMMGYFLLFDFGIGNAVIRYIAKYRAQNNQKRISLFLGNMVVLYACISLLTLLAGGICLIFFDSLFARSLNQDQLGSGKIMLLMAVVSIAIRFPASLFQGICMSYEKFIFLKSLSIFHYLVRIFAIFLILSKSPTGITLVAIDAILALLIYGINVFFVFSKIGIRFDFSRIKIHVFKEVFFYSFWILIMNISIALIWQIAPVFSGIYIGTSAVALISIAIILGSYYGTFAGAINGLLLPKTTAMVTLKASSQELTDLVIKVARFTAPLLICILGGFYLFGQQFIILWVGDSFLQSWFLALCAMLATTVSLSLCGGNSILESYGKVRTRSLFSLLSLGIGTLLSWWLVRKYGINGAMLPLLGTWILNTVFSCIYYKYVFGFQIHEFFKQTYFKALPCWVLCLLFGEAVKYFMNGSTWAEFIFQVALYSIFSLFAFLWIFYSACERKYIFSFR